MIVDHIIWSNKRKIKYDNTCWGYFYISQRCEIIVFGPYRGFRTTSEIIMLQPTTPILMTSAPQDWQQASLYSYHYGDIRMHTRYSHIKPLNLKSSNQDHLGALDKLAACGLPASWWLWPLHWLPTHSRLQFYRCTTIRASDFERFLHRLILP